MLPDTPEFQVLLNRVDKLEKQNRGMKQIAVVGLILIAAVLLTTHATQKGRTAEAEKFCLLDSSGKVRAELLMTGDGPSLKFYDVERKPRLILAVQRNTPTLGFYDPTGIPRIGITNTLEDGPSLWLASAIGKPQAQLDATGEHPRLYLEDKSGLAASIGDDTLKNFETGETQNTTATSLVLFGPNRKIIWRAP